MGKVVGDRGKLDVTSWAQTTSQGESHIIQSGYAIARDLVEVGRLQLTFTDIHGVAVNFLFILEWVKYKTVYILWYLLFYPAVFKSMLFYPLTRSFSSPSWNPDSVFGLAGDLRLSPSLPITHTTSLDYVPD